MQYWALAVPGMIHRWGSLDSPVHEDGALAEVGAPSPCVWDQGPGEGAFTPSELVCIETRDKDSGSPYWFWSCARRINSKPPLLRPGVVLCFPVGRGSEDELALQKTMMTIKAVQQARRTL